MESGRQIRFARYRRGGGAKGNVPAENLQSLNTSLAYISRVSNRYRASGGRDAEDLEEVKARARRELQAQLRAVTAEDYEHLAAQSTRTVARVKFNVPRGKDSDVPPGTVEVLIVPAVTDSLLVGDLSRLQVDQGLARTVSDYLDGRRLLTTTVHVRAPQYLGVRVRAEIIPAEYSRPQVVQARVAERLRNFISPLRLTEEADDLMDEGWKGWPFGRNLYVAEVFTLIQRVPGVKHVLDVQLDTRPVVPENEPPPGEPSPAAEELTPATQKVVRVPANTLLCSLDHEIVIAALEEEGDGE